MSPYYASLNSNRLTLTSTATSAFNLGTTSSCVNVTGNLTLAGTLNITDAGGFGIGSYTLFTYNGTLVNNGIAIGIVPYAYYTYAISTNTPGQVQLRVTAKYSLNDGIPDWWRAKYFSGVDPAGATTNYLSCATADADGTGQNNLLKYMADIDPTNPVSRFAIINITILANDVDIVWIGGSNAWQEIQCNHNLANTNTWSTIFTNVPPTAITNALVHTGAVTSTNLFYRIKAYR